MHRAKRAQGGSVWITQGIDLHPLRVSRPLVPQLLDHRRCIPFPGVTLQLSCVFVHQCLLPVIQLLDHCPLFPTDRLERFLICLVGIRRIVFLLVMALQALSPPPCAEVEALNLGHLRNAALTNGGKMALTIKLLRWANVLDLRGPERQLLARVQCP